MKEVKTERKVILYEAIDKTQFDSKEECEKYEKTAKCVITARFNQLEKQEVDSEQIILELFECTACIIQPKSEYDISTIAMYIQAISGISDKAMDTLYKAFEENKHVVICKSKYENNIWIECILEDYIETLKTFI